MASADGLIVPSVSERRRGRQHQVARSTIAMTRPIRAPWVLDSRRCSARLTSCALALVSHLRTADMIEDLRTPQEDLHNFRPGDLTSGLARRENQIAMLERYGLQSSSRVLEIGCGVGWLAYNLASRLTEPGGYAGLDVSEVVISWLNDNYASRLPNFRFDLLDVENARYRPKGAQARTGSVPARGRPIRHCLRLQRLRLSDRAGYHELPARGRPGTAPRRCRADDVQGDHRWRLGTARGRACLPTRSARCVYAATRARRLGDGLRRHAHSLDDRPCRSRHLRVRDRGMAQNCLGHQFRARISYSTTGS